MRTLYLPAAATILLLSLAACQKKADTAVPPATSLPPGDATSGASTAPTQPSPSGAATANGPAPAGTPPGSTTTSGAMGTGNAPIGTGATPPPK